jgi:hypothetical protein
VAGVTDDVGREVLPVGLGHHLAIHSARLDEPGLWPRRPHDTDGVSSPAR